MNAAQYGKIKLDTLLEVENLITQTYEGTLPELQLKLRSLPVNPDSRLKMIVSEVAERAQTEEEYFANPRTKNGITLIPSKKTGIPITRDLVKELSEDFQ